MENENELKTPKLYELIAGEPMPKDRPTIREQIEEIGIDKLIKGWQEEQRIWREILEQDEDWQHAKQNTMPYCNKGGSDDGQ